MILYNIKDMDLKESIARCKGEVYVKQDGETRDIRQDPFILGLIARSDYGEKGLELSFSEPSDLHHFVSKAACMYL